MAREVYTHGTAARKREIGRQVLPELKKQRRKIHLHFGNVLFAVAAVSVMIGVVFSYVGLQSDVTRERKELAALVTEYEDLRRQNDLYYERIVSSVDMQEIERIAREELGMRIAGEGQIVSYAGGIDDYVKQYSDIPTE